MAHQALAYAAGLFLILQAFVQLRNGQIVFDNASYHQTTFAAGGIGVGIVLLLLAFLPPREWVYRHITTKRTKYLTKSKELIPNDIISADLLAVSLA